MQAIKVKFVTSCGCISFGAIYCNPNNPDSHIHKATSYKDGSGKYLPDGRCRVFEFFEREDGGCLVYRESVSDLVSSIITRME